MKKLLFTILLSSLLLVGFSQSNESIENTVRRLDSLENVSFLNSNLAALDTLWAADMVVNNPQNTISRSSAITRESLKKGIIKHVVQERNIEHLVVKQNMVIVMGNEVIQNKADEPKYKRRFTNIWLKQGNSWKMAVRHANKIVDTQTMSQQDKEAEIRRLENLEVEALLKGDTVVLYKIWSPNMVVHNPANKVITLAEVKLRLGTGQLDYSAFESTIEKITFDDNIAIVMGEEKIRPQGISPHTGKLVTRRFTNVWKYRNGTWLQIARQGTIIKVE